MTRPKAPTRPGFYLDAAGEVWRVNPIDTPRREQTFDELIEHAIKAGPDQAMKWGPFTPLLAVTDDVRGVLLDALDHFCAEILPDALRDPEMFEVLHSAATIRQDLEGLA